MNNYIFPKGFLWGAASSGPQTEGITNKANLNVWDQWCIDEPHRFYNHQFCHKACDTYNRFKEDARLMKEVNMNSFRTSIQWSRLIRDLETNEVCDDGLRFYTEYFQSIIDQGIKPIINLYHFDMPQQLMDDYGGFESKHVVELFVGYSRKCFELFGDMIEQFTVFNEPIVPVEFGYFYDAHRPNKVDPKLGIQVAYNSILAQARVINEYRKMNLKGEIGTILNITPAYPRSQHPADLDASNKCDLIFNKSFIDPSVNGIFNNDLVCLLRENNLLPDVCESELKEIECGTVDFLGLNYYVPRRVCAPSKEPNMNGPWMPDRYFDNYQMPGSRNNPHRDNNEIYPRAVFDMAMDIKNNYGNIKWYLAEIGISITDEEKLMDEFGVIQDTFRKEILIEHLVELHKAINVGANCFGVHQWTFIDNWSWLNAHRRRYGLYYLDLETCDRTLKKQGEWFKQLASNNGFTSE